MGTPAEQHDKSDDKKDIELEEKEKMLNAQNNVAEKTTEAENVAHVPPSEKEPSKIHINDKEGREVQPRKIPIGGIQMPGFFTRSKSKEKCKEDDPEQGDAEATELLETKAKEKDDSLLQQARIKLPNPFRKSKTISEDEADKSVEPKEKKRLIDTIRLPLVSVFPRNKKTSEQNLENQSGVAGLASMETLDETDKTADKKDEELKNVSLEVDEKLELEKQYSDNEPRWKRIFRSYRIVISALLVFVLFLIAIIGLCISGKPSFAIPIRDGKYVETITSCGRVEGILDDGGVAFRGIPYARPPVGDLRFKPAQPLNRLEYCFNGTLLAHNATDSCVQIHSNSTTMGIEDCLTLDVVTPYVRYDTPLPVVVLIGTESLIGGSPGKMRPSGRYARSRDVVFVRPNFRLGALGFLALDILSKSLYLPTSGNYGLSDIVEALKWVQLNIEHFGGDPNAVTLFGHRAGATLVTALSSARGAQQLFSRAWATSGGAIYPGKPLSESEQENQSYLPSIQCEDVNCLLQREAELLMLAIPDTWRKPQPDLPMKSEEPDKRHEWLVLDGKILQEHPGKTWAEQPKLMVKLVLGTTAHAAASQKLLLKHTHWSEERVAQYINESKLGQLNLTEETLKLYEPTYKGLSALISDIRAVCPLLAVSTQMVNVPFYVVTQTRGEQDIADIDSDVDAILGRYEPKTVEQRRYVSAMQQLFYYYVWHGEVKQAEEFPNKVLIVGQDVLAAANYTHCDFWINKDIVPRYAQLD